MNADEAGREKLTSVVVPTMGRESLVSCLDSLVVQTRSSNEILVVDGSRGNSVAEICNRYPRTKLIKQLIGNYSHALNLGLNNSRGDIVAFIDDDAVADPNWLSELVQVYEMNDVGAVGGLPVLKLSKETSSEVKDVLTKFENTRSLIIDIVRSIYSSFFQENLPFLKISRSGVCIFEPRSVSEELTEVDFMTGCNMSFKSSALKMIGGFDENYVEHGECVEPDACLRLKKAGLRIVLNPKSIVYHTISGKSVKRSVYGRARNLYYFIAKNHLSENRLQFLKTNVYLTYRTAFYVGMYLRTRNSDYLEGLKGARHGFKILIRMTTSRNRSPQILSYDHIISPRTYRT